jgi:hypothetical protein
MRTAIRREVSNQPATVAGVACLFREFTSSGGDRIVIPSIYDSTQQFQGVTAVAVPILTHENDMVVIIKRDNMRPIEVLKE